MKLHEPRANVESAHGEPCLEAPLILLKVAVRAEQREDQESRCKALCNRALQAQADAEDRAWNHRNTAQRLQGDTKRKRTARMGVAVRPRTDQRVE
jgi:hypothetical protein